MDLVTGLAIVGGVAAGIYIVETAGKYGYALYKKSASPHSPKSSVIAKEAHSPFKKNL